MKKHLVDDLIEQDFKGHQFWSNSLLQGDPRQDFCVELLLRHGVPAGNKLCLVNFGCGAWISALQGNNTQQAQAVHVFCEDHIACEFNAKKQKATKVTSRLESVTTAGPSFAQADVVLLRVFRDMSWNWDWIRKILSSLRPGSSLQIIGAKDDGIQSIEKNCLKAGFPVEVVTIGCHSRWLLIPAGSGNIEALPTAPSGDWSTLRIPQGEFSHWCPEGVFAAGHLDVGTLLLLNNIGDLQGKTVWDFGCGSGVIARAALLSQAREVYASDHSLWAVEVAKRNLEEYGAKAKCGAHFLGEGIPGTYDRILSNPPFHLEGREMKQFGRIWLGACKDLLSPGGEIRLVANSFLSYGEFAKELAMDATPIVENKNFKIWKVTLRG